MTSNQLHTEVLNVLLMEINAAAVPSAGCEVHAAIENLWSRYTRYSSVHWREEYPEPDDPWADIESYYNPRVYVCLGAFDLSAIYLSPIIGQLFPPPNTTSHAGHNVLTGLLPKSDAMNFNQKFIDEFKIPRDSEKPLAPDRRYSLLAKLKFNAAVIWPVDGSKDNCRDRYDKQLEHAAKIIQDWLDRLSQRGDKPLAALSLGLGWSEIMIVAHASHVSDLIELLWRLRQQSGKNMNHNSSHSYTTTLSHIGYDHRVCVEVEREITNWPESLGPMTADNLVELAFKISGSAIFKAPKSSSSRHSINVCPSYSAYPGHENKIADLIDRASAADAWKIHAPTIHTEIVGRKPMAQMGKHDLGGPLLQTGKDLNELTAFSYVNLLNRWIQNDRAHPVEMREQTSIQNFFEVSTSVGIADLGSFGESDFPADHSGGTSGAFLNLRSDEKGDDLHIADAIERQLAEIVESLRLLQVPYSRSEQIANLVSKFDWAARHVVVGEESLTFAPLVFCLRDYLGDLVTMWNSYSQRPWPGIFNYSGERDLNKRMAVEIRNHLERFYEHDLSRLLDAMRANFHQLHMSGYLADLTQDVSLRYRGSVQQLINITNLLLDRAVSVLLGDRACVTKIGDFKTPRVTRACNVVISELHADVITMPILLETLAHEVGHELIQTLHRARPPEGRPQILEPRAGTWGRGCIDSEEFRQLALSYNTFREEVFHGESTHLNNYFRESTCDYIDLVLLGHTNPHDWAKSFLFRFLMAAQPTSQEIRNNSKNTPDDSPANGADNSSVMPLVPNQNEFEFQSAINRVVFVVIADLLCKWYPVHMKQIQDLPADKRPGAERAAYPDLVNKILLPKLELLRLHLLRECVIGPAEEILRSIESKPSWWAHLDKKIFCLPWLMDYDGVRAAAEFYHQMASYISSRKNFDESTGGRGQPHVTWSVIETHMKNLREQYLEHLTPCILVRHWFSHEEFPEKDEPQKHKRRFHMGRTAAIKSWANKIPYCHLPWRVVEQPFQNYLDTPDGKKSNIEFNTAIMQRMRVVPLKPRVSKQLTEANHEFIANMLALLPAWRKDVLDRIRVLEQSRLRPDKRD